MNNDQVKLLEMVEEIAKMKKLIDELSGNFYKNNFSDRQDFQKYCSFNTKLRVPVYSVLPTTSEIGEIVSDTAGTLYISTATNTWTVCGTQT